jgi:hypothetical protein
MPTTVVPGFLYLGSYDTASRQELLKAMQITDILNVRAAGRAARTGAPRLRACTGQAHRSGLLGMRAASVCLPWRLARLEPLQPLLCTLPRADGAGLPAAVQEHLQLPHGLNGAAGL